MSNHEILTLVVGVFSIVFGLLVIIRPQILAYIVGIYLIASGVLWIIRSLVG